MYLKTFTFKAKCLWSITRAIFVNKCYQVITPTNQKYVAGRTQEFLVRLSASPKYLVRQTNILVYFGFTLPRILNFTFTTAALLSRFYFFNYPDHARKRIYFPFILTSREEQNGLASMF